MLIDQDAGDGGVTTSQAFANTLDIGYDAFLFPSVQSSAAAHSAHDLIENEKCSVLLADCFHGGEVAWYSRDAAE